MVVNLFPRQFQPNGLRGAFSLAYLSSYFNVVEGKLLIDGTLGKFSPYGD